MDRCSCNVARDPQGTLQATINQRNNKMKLLALTLALSLAMPAHAGGPVIIEEPPEEGQPALLLSPGEKLALTAGLLVVGALLLGGGGSDDCPCLTPDEGGQCTC